MSKTSGSADEVDLIGHSEGAVTWVRQWTMGQTMGENS
jgi:hypothetical protein